MNFNVVKVVKVAGTVMSVAGMIATGWAGDKMTKATLEKLVNEHLSK